MIEPDHIKTKILSEDGTNIFQSGKAVKGQLIFNFPDKLFVQRIEMSLQKDSIVVAEDLTITKRGEYAYDFTFTRPLNPGRHTHFSRYDDVAIVTLHSDFGSDFVRTDYRAHAYEAGFKITNTVRLENILDGSFSFKRKSILPFFLVANTGLRTAHDPQCLLCQPR